MNPRFWHSKGTVCWTLSWLILAAGLFAQGGTAATIEQTYSFAYPQIQAVKIDGQLFDAVEIEDCPLSGPIGQPALPTRRARILLPEGQQLTSVEVVTGRAVPVASGLHLPPMDLPINMSAPKDQIPPLALDTSAYASHQVMPATKVLSRSIQTFRGYRVALIDLIPVEYLPAEGSLSYYPQMKLVVKTAPAAISSSIRGMVSDEMALSARVDNAAALSSYINAATPVTRTYDLLIISPTDLATAYEPLKTYHDAHGVLTEIRTLDQIGANDPHTVRDYIRNEYLTNGISLVLIGGDDNLIPALDLFVQVIVSDGGLAEYDMPGDFYFACLDGTFNYDGDAYWGEPTDGEGGGEIDLLPEVGIGRVSAGSVQEVNNLVTKTLAYLESDDSYLSKVLLAGEQLRFGGLGEYGGYAMEEMINGSIAHGFTTCAFPADQYDIDKLYDVTATPTNYWPPSEIISHINAGVHIVDHLGHSYIGYAMRTDTTMVKNQLTNDEYCFLYAEGCTAGRFDFEDCWAEYVTVKLPTGGFGCVANSRSGLGSRTTQHPVHVINREFWDAIYSGDERFPELGLAMLDARFDLADRINDPGMRWTYYETNLFADPAVRIKGVRSLTMLFPGETPSTVVAGETTEFDVNIIGSGDGELVAGSALLHYSVDGAAQEQVPLEPVRGDLYQAAIPPMQCGQTIEFYVSAEETASGRHYAPDPASPLRAMAVTEDIVVFEDDFESDLGWTVSGGLWSRGVPQGTGGQELQYPAPDPEDGCVGTNVMGYNLHGDYTNGMPAYHVTSPAIDCSDMYNTRLRYCRWLGVEQPAYDKATVSISTNAINWTTLWQNPATISDLQWNDIEYDISAYADYQPEVFLRWTMGPTDAGLAYCGWNIDDVRLVSLYCQSWICADIDGNGDGPDIADLVYLVTFMFRSGPPPPEMATADINGDGSSSPDIADLVHLVTYMFQNGAPPACD